MIHFGVIYYHYRRFDGAHLESREDPEDRTVTSASGRASHRRCAEKRAIHRGKNHPTCRFLLASGLIDFPRACSAENSVFCGDFRGTRAEREAFPGVERYPLSLRVRRFFQSSFTSNATILLGEFLDAKNLSNDPVIDPFYSRRAEKSSRRFAEDG